mmetsp:Transcript_85/g.699  ORF Transcript_85/g.699 Transcript_85/m.699 type:complete len:153 (-) Transcript_85:1385-1843(-)
MTTSTHRGTNLYSALGSRKGPKNGKEEGDVDDSTPKDEGTGPATSMDAAIAIQSSWAHADTWEGDGEDLGELPEGWVQEEVRDWLAFEIPKADGSVPKDANQAALGRRHACGDGREGGEWHARRADLDAIATIPGRSRRTGRGRGGGIGTRR